MVSCKELCKSMETLLLYSQYMFSLLMYVVKNKHLFTRNFPVHNHDTRSAKNFHLPITNLTIYQKGAYYMGIKIFNYLPTHIQNVTLYKFLKRTYRDFFLITHFFLLMNILMLINDIHFWLQWFHDVIDILLCNHCIIIVFCHLTYVI
jgi:hypothetical protein